MLSPMRPAGSRRSLRQATRIKLFRRIDRVLPTGTVTLEKGTYTFRCTISGHEAAGMKGKITVS